MAGGSDIVLSFFEDEAEQFGDADPAATVVRRRDASASAVVVRNGRGPPTASDGAGGTQVIPVEPAPRVVDAIAAGDLMHSWDGSYP